MLPSTPTQTSLVASSGMPPTFETLNRTVEAGAAGVVLDRHEAVILVSDGVPGMGGVGRGRPDHDEVVRVAAAGLEDGPGREAAVGADRGRDARVEGRGVRGVRPCGAVELVAGA
jgi:hypothetical protein